MQAPSSPITAEELREILADAFEGAAQRLRGHTIESPTDRVVAPPTGSPASFELNVGRLTLTVDETAKGLGISRSAAYEAIHRGDIPSLRFGRRVLVPVAALSRHLEQQTIG